MATPVQGKFISRTKNPNKTNQYTVVRAITNETLETTGSNNNTAFFADGTGYSLTGADGGVITGG